MFAFVLVTAIFWHGYWH